MFVLASSSYLRITLFYRDVSLHIRKTSIQGTPYVTTILPYTTTEPQHRQGSPHPPPKGPPLKFPAFTRPVHAETPIGCCCGSAGVHETRWTVAFFRSNAKVFFFGRPMMLLGLFQQVGNLTGVRVVVKPPFFSRSHVRCRKMSDISRNVSFKKTAHGDRREESFAALYFNIVF